LLARADRVLVLPQAERPDSYLHVGEYVVESCDVLIAIWDGKPSRGEGGTKDILDLARLKGMPVFVIPTDPQLAVVEERLPLPARIFKEIERYNRVDSRTLSRHVMGSVPSPSDLTPEEARMLEPYLAWIRLPFFRADFLARRYRLRFVYAARLLLLLSAFAVLAATLSVSSESHGAQRAFAYTEVGLMLTALALWFLARKRLHIRWIAGRFLAERLRSAMFLAVVQSEEISEPRTEGEHRGNPQQEWLTRVFREVWRLRPRLDRVENSLDHVKRLLRRGWVNPQIAYYRRRGRHHVRAFRIVTLASAVLFVATIVAAALHASQQSMESTARVLAILSISLPAFAGAITGIGALEQHARHAERFTVMARRLERIGERLEGALDPDQVRDVATRVEAELRTETDAWIDVMRFQDVELPV
jgi:hypothetical protein